MAKQNPQQEHWSSWIPYLGVLVGLVSAVINPALVLSILAIVLGAVGLVISLRATKGSRSIGIIVSSAAIVVGGVVTFVGLTGGI